MAAGERKELERVVTVLNSEFSAEFVDKEQELLQIERNIQNIKLELDIICRLSIEVKERTSFLHDGEEEVLLSNNNNFESASVECCDSPLAISGRHEVQDFHADNGLEAVDDHFVTKMHSEYHGNLISKTIIVGNTSKYLLNQSDSDGATHKWMVYVRGLPDDDISKYVKSVWFLLDPSYRPNDCIHVSVPPFQLVRRGWGEFPVRIQIIFHNWLNKPVDVIHRLTLDRTKTGQQMRGLETVVNLPLYFEDTEVSSQEGSTGYLSDLSNDKIPKSFLSHGRMMFLVKHDHPYSKIFYSGDQNSSVISSMHSFSDSPVLENYLKDLVNLVPLIGTPTEHQSFTASTLEEYSLWSRVKQNSCEWMRAVALKGLVHSRLLLPSHVNILSTREVVYWCRREGYTPFSMPVMYCKRCGKKTHDSGFLCCDLLDLNAVNSVSNLLPFFRNIQLPSSYNSTAMVNPCSSLPNLSKAEVLLQHDLSSYNMVQYSEDSMAIKGVLEKVGLDFKFPTDISLGSICYSMLYKAVQCFLRHLIHQALTDVKKSHQFNTCSILPIHVYQSLKGNAIFHFLLNQHQGVE